MTYTEDLKRLQEFRIEALEKRIEFLEAQIEVNINTNQFKNEDR